LAESCGRTSAALADSFGGANSKFARDMFKQQASMFGLATKEDILEFIRIATQAATQQSAVLAEIE
jgi:hypothetical protein